MKFVEPTTEAPVAVIETPPRWVMPLAGPLGAMLLAAMALLSLT